MDYTTASQLIGSLGFPIVACVAMFWKMNKDSADHKEEVTRLADVIADNTTAITALTSHIKNSSADEQ